MEIQELKEALLKSYSKDLCYPKVRDNWSEDNKCYGMCAITALIVDDYFGTDFGKITVEGISHYFNIKDGEIIDLTAEQFKNKVDYSNYGRIKREDILENSDTKARYLKLKKEVYENLRML